MPHPRINLALRGKYVKMSGYVDDVDRKRKDWIKVSDIAGAKKETGGLRVRLKGGKPDFLYAGANTLQDHVKDKLGKEGIGD
jgi:hypothetical protein